MTQIHYDLLWFLIVLHCLDCLHNIAVTKLGPVCSLWTDFMFLPIIFNQVQGKAYNSGQTKNSIWGWKLVCLNYLLICTFAGCSKINLLIFQCYDITLHCISDQMFWAFAQPLDVSTNYWFSFLVKVDGTMWEPPLVLMLGYCPEWSLLSISWNK